MVTTLGPELEVDDAPTMVIVLSITEVLEDVVSLKLLAPGGANLDLRLVLANDRQRLMIINI